MLFVFGYRAQKLRSKKLSVVLHKSSAFPNINSATVAVHFKQILDKENNVIEHIENSDLVVSRTVFKDNSSHYSIDGKKVHFKEVAKLLKGHGIDLDHNRFLILQGEVESIAMMKPTGKTDNECGLLEYLEDIIGTARYKQPLIKINDRVEILNEERTEKSNRCKLAEREMKDLENPKNEAVQYLKLENEFEKNKNLNIQKNILITSRLVTELSTDLEASTNILKKHDDELKLLMEERVEKEAIIKAENQKNESLRKEKETCEQKLKNTENQQINIQALLESSNKERKQFSVQVSFCCFMGFFYEHPIGGNRVYFNLPIPSLSSLLEIWSRKNEPKELSGFTVFGQRILAPLKVITASRCFSRCNFWFLAPISQFHQRKLNLCQE